jgi:hypothetical protein
MSERTLRATGRRVHERRWVSAPPGSDPSAANRVIGLWLSPGERVSWEWATSERGCVYVCGYSIEQSRRRDPRVRRQCGFRVDA